MIKVTPALEGKSIEQTEGRKGKGRQWQDSSRVLLGFTVDH